MEYKLSKQRQVGKSWSSQNSNISIHLHPFVRQSHGSLFM